MMDSPGVASKKQIALEMDRYMESIERLAKVAEEIEKALSTICRPRIVPNIATDSEKDIGIVPFAACLRMNNAKIRNIIEHLESITGRLEL